MMQAAAMISAQIHGPVANQSLAQDGDPNSNQQMVMSPSTYSQFVPDTLQLVSHVQTLQQASYAQQIPHQATYMKQISIQPQQPCYKIDISQVATTNRALTPMTDFSETEEGTKSDDNDDRLSWQEVSERGKKRTSSRTTKVPTMKKNKPQDTNNHQTQLTTANKFEPLRPAETESNTRHEKQDPAPPPIFVPRITNTQQLTAKIEQVVNRLNYTLNE
jgi:hypothetical protein